MMSYRDRKIGAVWGPGQHPALTLFIVCLLECFVLTQSVLSIPLTPYYVQPQRSKDSQIGARDSRFDAERAVHRFRQRSRQGAESQRRTQEKYRDAEQVQEVQQGVAQDQRVSRAIAQQEKQEAAQVIQRMDAIDRYSIDKTDGVWRTHFNKLVEAWNVFSQDLFGNVSRSHMTEFAHNDLHNVAGFDRRTVDQAGRVTETVVSDTTYQEGETPWNYLSRNKEASRTEVTTTYHPTGNQKTRTELFDLKYEDGRNGKLLSQKAKIADLSGPNHPILQESFNMVYDGDNVVSSEMRVTDLITGTATESLAKNTFSGNQLVSSTTESIVKDPIRHTFTKQSLTQNVSYENGRVHAIDVKSTSTTHAMDETGNLVEADFVQETETTQTMGVFFGIPQVVESVSVTKAKDNISVQTSEATLTQKYIRDEYGNLLNLSGVETAMSANIDRSVVQNTDSLLEFTVIADTPYLIGREDQSFTRDLINDQAITTHAHFKIRLGDRGEVLEGTRQVQTHATNRDGSIVTDSEGTERYDRAAKVNELSLVTRKTSSRTINSIVETNIVTTEENRLYSQRHDGLNRVLGGDEKVTSVTTDEVGRETRVEGTVTYAAGLRSNQPYAVESVNHITSKDPFSFLYTESNQTTRFESDAQTGRALQGIGVTESTTWRMTEDGTARPDLLVIHTHAEDTLQGLSQSNGFGLVSRSTVSETNDVLNGFVTQREEELIQKVNGVGKIEEAYAISRSTGQDGSGQRQVFNLSRTDFKITANDLIPISTKSVEVSIDHGTYRVVAREDIHRTDALGRYFGIDNNRPEASGYQVIFHHDVTVSPIPQSRPNLESLYQWFFGREELG